MANFCANCGEHLEAGTRFCGSCGHPVEASTSDQPTTVVPVTPPPAATVAPSGAAAAGAGIDRSRWWMIGAGVLALGLLVAIVMALTQSDSAEAEVFLVAADDPGPDPFTASVASAAPAPTAPASTTAPTTTAQPTTTVPPTTAAAGQVPARSGAAQGLYGGTGNAASCDRDQLVAFLAAEPAKATAWVAALNSDPTLRWAGGSTLTASQIAAYVDELTPVVLSVDTRATNHGYRNGAPTTFQAVLQAGTAVMVDRYGVPRVKCGCGNPLTAPRALTGSIGYRGTPWVGWNPRTVIIILQSVTIIDQFILVNRSGPGWIVRPAGSAGGEDVPTSTPSVPPPTTTTTSTTTTTTTTTPQPPTTLPPFTPPQATLPPFTPPPATARPGGSPFCADAVVWYNLVHSMALDALDGVPIGDGAVNGAISATDQLAVPSQYLAELMWATSDALAARNWTAVLDAVHEARPEIMSTCGTTLVE